MTIPVGACAPSFTTDGRAAWRRLGWALMVGTIGNASLWTAVCLMPELERQFDLSRTEASYPYIAIMLGFFLGNPVFGGWSDRAGITPVLIVSALIGCAGYVLGAVTTHFGVFLLTQVAVGVGTSVGFAPLMADISHWFRRRRGLALALCGTSAYVSGLIWTSLIPILLTVGSWRLVHVVIGLSLLSSIPIAFWMRARIPAHALAETDRIAAQNAEQAGLSARRIKVLLMISGVSCCIAMAMPQVHIVAYCIDLGYSLAQGGGLLSMMLFAGILSRILVGILLDRIGVLQILLAALILQAVAIALYLQAGGLSALYTVSLIFGLSQGGILPAYPLIVRAFLPARSAGAVIGAVSMATLAGMAGGSWVAGWIYDATQSYAGALLNGLGWNAVSIAIVLGLMIRLAQRRRLGGVEA